MPDGLLNDGLVSGIARAFNTKTGRIVTLPSGSKAVLSSAGEIDATHYIDPIDGSVYQVNHYTLVSYSV